MSIDGMQVRRISSPPACQNSIKSVGERKGRARCAKAVRYHSPALALTIWPFAGAFDHICADEDLHSLSQEGRM